MAAGSNLTRLMKRAACMGRGIERPARGETASTAQTGRRSAKRKPACASLPARPVNAATVNFGAARGIIPYAGGAAGHVAPIHDWRRRRIPDH